MRVAGEAVPPFADFARGVPLLAGLERSDTLAGATQPFALADGEPLFVQDDLARGAYFVASGTLAVSARTPGDGERALARVGPGGVVGELCLLDRGRRSAEARAHGPVAGYRLDYERFSGLLAGGHPAAAEIVARLRSEVARRIAEALAAIGDDGTPGAEAALPRGAPADAEEAAGLLKPFPGYADFRPEDWAAFATLARRVDVQRGTVLAAPGAAQRQLLVVARGALSETIAGRQVIVHGPARIANAAAATLGNPWPTQLTVRESGTVFALDAAAGPGPRLTELLGLQLTRDLRRLTRERNRADDPALETA